jgi:putative oxidoreductase
MTTSSGGELPRIMLRAAIGGTMIAHGMRHGRTLAGTAGWFGSIGFRQPKVQALASTAVEVGAGTALVAGAATPLAAAAVVGTMAVAGYTVHRPNGFFVVKDGYEYVGNLAVASVALAALGPGRFSVDHALGVDDWATRPRRAILAAGLGLAVAAGQLAIFWRKPAPKGEVGPEPAPGPRVSGGPGG